MELISAIFHTLHEWISGIVNHPRFGNSKRFKLIAPGLITGLLALFGVAVTAYFNAERQIAKLEKDISELKIQQMAPSKESAGKDVKIAELQATLTAQREKITDLEKQLTDIKTENVSLRERVFNKDPVKPAPVEKPKHSDSILESSNRRLKRLGDKKDDPIQ